MSGGEEISYRDEYRHTFMFCSAAPLDLMVIYQRIRTNNPRFAFFLYFMERIGHQGVIL